MEDIVAKVKKSFPEFELEPQDDFDRIKSFAKDVSRRVETSSLLANDGKFKLALEEAEEATKALNLLKQAISKDQQQRSSSSRPNSNISMTTDSTKRVVEQDDTSQPMTTGVNLLELSIMVKCNLAEQLKNNGQLESSLEMYTQLCKMAIDQVGGSGSSSFISEPNGNQQQQQQQSRYLLYRFGLNIGNVLCDMKEYQRALKYYRLTLDRLSSMSGNRNLQIKLMHNITIGLMAMNGILAYDNAKLSSFTQQSQKDMSSTLVGLSKTNDHVTSLQLLLNDNSFETQQKPANLNKSIVGAGSSYGSKIIATKQVLNCNHHKFGLNLVVCQYKNFDLSPMFLTLKSLVQVDGRGSQYKRVLNFDKQDGNDEKRKQDLGEQELVENKSSLAEINKLLLDELLDHLNDQASSKTAHASASLSSALQNKSNRDEELSLVDRDGNFETGADDKLNKQSTASVHFERGTEYDVAPSHLNSLEGNQSSFSTQAKDATASSDVRAIIAANRLRQVTRVARADELESMICRKEREIHRSLITSCNLMIDLDRRACIERQQQHQRSNYQQQGQNYRLVGSRLFESGNLEYRQNTTISDRLVDDNEENSGVPKRTGGGGGRGGGSNGTSALSQCVKLVATSDLYKGLTEDLMANSVSKLLPRRGKLLKALYLLERIGLDQQVGNVSVASPPASGESSVSKAQRVVVQGNQVFCAGLQMPITTNYKSALVATNLGLLYLLRDQINIALQMNKRALIQDKFNVESLVNMGNCQLKLNEMQRADQFYVSALKIKPDFWMTHFNRMLMNIKLGRHPDDIDDLSTPDISKELDAHKTSQRFGSFLRVKMALTQLQTALLYKQSGMIQRSNTILNSMLADGKSQLSPEIFLLASKCSPSSQGNSDDGRHVTTNTPTSPIIILQKALKIHPYHIPTVERLIALYINNFDYKSAIAILADCIRNRPDQVKWYQMLAECHRRGADYNEAIKIYKHAVELFPMNESCLKALGKLADELGLADERAACQTRLQHLSQAQDQGFV